MSKRENTVIKFGTDGWRGIIAEDFTFDNVKLCAQATANYLLENNTGEQPVVAVGYDTRFASDDFAKTTAGVMAGNGIQVVMSDSTCATPALSHATAARKARAGIMITASHNPPNWNGFKIKAPNGSSASPETIKKIEEIIMHTPPDREPLFSDFDQALSSGLVTVADINSPYIESLEQLVDTRNLRNSSLKVVFDGMYGSGSGYLGKILSGGNLGIIEINTGPNPAFPGIKQPEPIGHNLLKLSSTVRDIGAGIGLAADGDADRLGVVDETGRYLNTLQVYALLVLYLLESRGERGAIVKTITSSQMLDRLGEIYGVPVYEVPVGFKYVAPVMIEKNAMVGGEESGGYGYRGHIPERDGILSGLYFLDYMVKTGKKPSQLIQLLYDKVGPHYFERFDLEFAPEKKQEIFNRVKQSSPATITGRRVIRRDDFDGIRFLMENRSWLLIRFSGTEPLLRLYAEAESPASVAELLQEGKALAGMQGD
ncbi:MAG: phosphoglucomutase/phosphomannomutase family protein [Dehalococcoidales bacterium]|nr:phosphoglucomutase/phosphomannomutase family protein [Dehalococcoidales bacterium]